MVPETCACGCATATKPGNKYAHGHNRARPVAERFWAKVNRTDGCWLWTGGVSAAGYGSIGVAGSHIYAHRYSYESARGPIPDGLIIDHICGNRRCVNPAHLRLATRAQNQENLPRVRANNTSGYRGAFFDKQRGKWKAIVKKAGVNHCGGHFDTPEEAGDAARELRNKLMTHNVLDRREV